MKPITWLICVCIVLLSCNKSKDYKTFLQNPDLFSKTVHELNTVVMGNNFPPMVASRNYAYAAIAAYEVIAAGNPSAYTSLVGQLNGFNQLNRSKDTIGVDLELAAFMAYITVGEAVTFPEGSMKQFKDSILSIARTKGLSAAIEKKSQIFADSISNSVLLWSKTDHYLETRGAEKYSVNDVPGRWVPTPPLYGSAVEPHWKEIRTMVIDSAGFIAVEPPPIFNVTDKTSKYYQELMLIKNAVDSLTEEQKHIAIFWDDNPFKMNVTGHAMIANKKFSPPGHWMSIVGIGAKKLKADFATTVTAYAKTSIALFDAFIQAWHVKYTYNTARPETVINKYIDINWRPILQTPDFPEYTCGHNTISAAAAEAITSVFGDHVPFTDSTELEFGIKSRSFKSFRAAAGELNLARFYGGVHFHHSCMVSTNNGKKVGSVVVDRLTMKK
jgi:hypothetical protein